MRMLRVAAFVVALAFVSASAQAPAVPGRNWEKVADAAKAGWAPAGVKAACDYSHTLPTAAAMIVAGGGVVDPRGAVATRYHDHSIRQRFLGALYGTHGRERRIELSAT